MAEGEFSKYNQAVLAKDQYQELQDVKSQVSEEQKNISEQKSSLNKQRIDFDKGLKQAVLSGSKYSPESVLASKKAFQQRQAELAAAEKELSQVQSSVQSAENKFASYKSSVKTPAQLEAAGYKKRVSGNQIIYYKEDTYYRNDKDRKRKRKSTYIEEEYTFTDQGIPIKFIERDDYEDRGKRKVDIKKQTSFSNGIVSEYREYDDFKDSSGDVDMELELLERYDSQGRITNITEYRKGEKSERKTFSYDDKAGTVNIFERDYEKERKRKERAAKDAQTVINTYEVYDKKTGTTSTRTLYKDGSFSDQVKSKDVYTVKISTDKETGVKKEEFFGKDDQLIKTITKTPIKSEIKVTREEIEAKASLTPEAQKFAAMLNKAKDQKQLNDQIAYYSQYQSVDPNLAKKNQAINQNNSQNIKTEGLITEGGNQIRQFGQELQTFKVDDKQNTFGVPKAVEKGVRIIGAGVETFGEFVNLADAPVQYVKGLVGSAEKRGEDGEFGFQDTVLTFNDAYQSTAKNIDKNSPTISKVVGQDLDWIGDKLSEGGQKVKSQNLIPDPIENKARQVKDWAIDKTQTVVQTGVDLTYSGFEQTQKEGAVNKFIGTAKQDAGIALTLLGEAGSGILQPVKYSKITEETLARSQTDNRVLKASKDVAEVLSGGGSYAAEIISDPKTYIAGEFEEAAILAKNPRTRGGEIIESVATNPKGFLKASIGETIFVTGAYTLGKAALTDFEVGTRVAANEASNIATDIANTPKKPKTDFEESFSQKTPFDKPEYISLDSVDFTPSKPPKTPPRPQGFETVGEFAYKTDVVNVDFNLPNMPEFRRPEINIGRNTKIKASEVGFIVGNSLNNSLVVGYKRDNQSELGFDNRNIEEIKFDNRVREEIKFDNKYDNRTEIKFDEKYDFRTDNKTDNKTDTRTDFKFDEKFDYKYDYRYDQRIDEKTDQRTDIKFDMKLFGKGQGIKAKGFSFESLKDDGRYIGSLGAAITGKTTKNPIKDITGLKLRPILVNPKKSKKGNKK